MAIAVTGAAQDRAAIRVHDIGLAIKKNDAGEVSRTALAHGGIAHQHRNCCVNFLTDTIKIRIFEVSLLFLAFQVREIRVHCFLNYSEALLLPFAGGLERGGSRLRTSVSLGTRGCQLFLLLSTSLASLPMYCGVRPVASSIAFLSTPF